MILRVVSIEGFDSTLSNKKYFFKPRCSIQFRFFAPEDVIIKQFSGN